MSESQIGGLSLMDSMQAYDITIPNRSGEKAGNSIEDDEDALPKIPYYQDGHLAAAMSLSSQRSSPNQDANFLESELGLSFLNKAKVRSEKSNSKEVIQPEPSKQSVLTGDHVGRLASNPSQKTHANSDHENTKKKESTSNAASGVTNSSQTEKHVTKPTDRQGGSAARPGNFLDSKSGVWPHKTEVQRFEVLKGSIQQATGHFGTLDVMQNEPKMQHSRLEAQITSEFSSLGNKRLGEAAEHYPSKLSKKTLEIDSGTNFAPDSRSTAALLGEKGTKLLGTVSLRDSRERDHSHGSDSASLSSGLHQQLNTAAALKKVSSNLNRMSKKSSEFQKGSSGGASPTVEAKCPGLHPTQHGLVNLQREPNSQNSHNYSVQSGKSNQASRSKSRDRCAEVVKPLASVMAISSTQFSQPSSAFGLSASKSNQGNKVKKAQPSQPEPTKGMSSGDGFKKKSYYNILKTSCKEHADRLIQDRAEQLKKKDAPRVNSRVLAMIKNISAAPGLTALMANGVGTRSAKNPSSRDSSNSAKRSSHSGHAKSVKSKASSTSSKFDPHDLKRGIKFRAEVPEKLKSASKKARNTTDLTGTRSGASTSHPGKTLLSGAASSSGSTGFQDKFAHHTLGGLLRKAVKNGNLTTESEPEDDSSLEDQGLGSRLEHLRANEPQDPLQSRKLTDLLKKMNISEPEEKLHNAKPSRVSNKLDVAKKDSAPSAKVTLIPHVEKQAPSVLKGVGMATSSLAVPSIEVAKGLLKSSSSGRREEQRPMSSSSNSRNSQVFGSSGLTRPTKDLRDNMLSIGSEKITSSTINSGLLLSTPIDSVVHGKPKTPHMTGVSKQLLGGQSSYQNSSLAQRELANLAAENKKKKSLVAGSDKVASGTGAKNFLLNAQVHQTGSPGEAGRQISGVQGVGTVAKATESRPRSSSSKGRKQYQPTALGAIKTSLSSHGPSPAGLNIFSPNSYLITHVHQVNNFINK